MTTDTLEMNVALEQMFSAAGGDVAGERSAEFDLRRTLSETVVRETGYAEFLAALRASGHATA
jgi:hypothetical protein